MHSETEQRLATLEVILEQQIHLHLPCHEDGGNLQPYAWDANIQSEFTPLNLIKSEGWITETDPEVAFTNWLSFEQNGLASEFIYPYEKDPANIFLDDKIKTIRYQKYYELLESLIDNIQDLQAFNFSFNSHYSLSIVVGKIPDIQRWISLAAIVPQETPEFINQFIQCSPLIDQTKSNLELEKPSPVPLKKKEGLAGNRYNTRSEIETKIKNILTQLDGIKIYGYYSGGYCHIHDFKVICTSGSTKEAAINNALLSSGLVEIYKFEKFTGRGRGGWGLDNYEASLINFLDSAFPELLLYRFCFWDYEHIYILGQTGTFGDRVGISLHSEFTYNP